MKVYITAKRIMFGRRNYNVLVTLLLFTTITNIAFARTGSNYPDAAVANTISGTVFDESRHPVADIFVELQDDFYRSISRVRTNGSGRYFFTGMRDGRYTLRVIPGRYDFEEQNVSVEVVNFKNRSSSTGILQSSSDNVQQDIYMRSRNNSSNSSFVRGVVFVQEIPKAAEQIYDRAVSLTEEKDTAERTRLLRAAVNAFPTYFLALNRLGYEYFTNERFEEASEYLARAADVNSSSEPTIYLLTYSLYLARNYDVAIEVASRAIDLHGTSARLYTSLGASLRLKKRYKEAEERLKKAKTLDTKYAETHWELALLYGNDLNKFGEAANELEQFLKVQPKSKDVEKIKGLIKKFREKEKAKATSSVDIKQ